MDGSFTELIPKRRRECFMTPIPLSFYSRRPDIVAKELIGSIASYNNNSCIIVETEAYFGDCDPGSRASRYKGGRIRRRLFGEPGRYLIYGMHGWLLTNIVAHEEGGGGAVLIRSCMSNNGRLIQGPGRVSRFLGIEMIVDGARIGESGSPMLFCGYAPSSVTRLHRVNVREDFDEPFRYAWTEFFTPTTYKPRKLARFTPC